MRRFCLHKLRVITASYFYLRSKRKRREYGIHPINQTRKKLGEFFTLIKMLEEDPMRYFNYFRMSNEQFNQILDKIKPCLMPKYKHSRSNIISPEEKLVITLRYRYV